MANLSPILAELEALYPKLVQTYGAELQHWGAVNPDPPVITLASKGRKRTQTGWYNVAKWTDSQEDVLAGLAGVSTEDREQLTRAEVVIATEILGEPKQAAAELLKQTIVHFYAAGHNDNVEGLVGAQGYYPEVWESVASRFGFIAVPLADQPSRGWASWFPNPQSQSGKNWEAFLRDNLDQGRFEVARKSDAPLKRPGSRMKKWQCDCTVIRSATRVTATCHSCGKLFHWAEKELPPNDTYQMTQDQADAMAASGSNTTQGA